jgi:hypothetical protein
MLSYDQLVNINLQPKYVSFPIGRKAFQNTQLELFFQSVAVYDLLNEFILLVTIEAKREPCTLSVFEQIKSNSKILDRNNRFYNFEYMRAAIKIAPKFPLSSSPRMANRVGSSAGSTLILTSFNRSELDENTLEKRELFYANAINQFQARGICLREAMPSLYKNLYDYVEENRSFAPVCLSFDDKVKGEPFLCLILPNSVQIDYSNLFDDTK